MKRDATSNAINQMKRAAKKGKLAKGHDLAKDADFLRKTHVAAFVWLIRENGTHLFPADYVANHVRDHWRSTLCQLHSYYTQLGESFHGFIFESGKLRPSTLRQCHRFLTLRNGQGNR